MKTQPYVCRIHIENFRNFHSVDFCLGEKQVLIGENAVGKSNLLYTLQLILDPTLSEKDRMLEESDFFFFIDNPMDNGHYILIEIYLANFEDNKSLFAQLADASVMVEGKERLKISYKFFKKDTTKPDYSYIIYKGNDESRAFTYEDRKILNIRVIKAIRDVEAEMKSSRTSPLTQIIKQKYTISKDVLSEISRALDEKGADTLQIGQVNDLENRLQRLLNDMVSFSADEFNVSLKTMNIDATKLLYALRPLINSRETGNTSLGINNILYVALILLLIEDDTIKTFLSGDLYCEFSDFTILTEVTMSTSSRQEAMEGEPVRRHVADAAERYDKPVYGLFIANKIDTNTAETFRHGVWYGKDDIVQRLTIVPLTLKQFQKYFEAMFTANKAHPNRLKDLLLDCNKQRDDLTAPMWKGYIESTVTRYIDSF